MTQTDTLISHLLTAVHASKAGNVEETRLALEAASRHPSLCPKPSWLNKRLFCQNRIADALRSPYPEVVAHTMRLIAEHLPGSAHQRTVLTQTCQPGAVKTLTPPDRAGTGHPHPPAHPLSTPPAA